MASRLFFNGRQYVTPAAPSAVNDDAMAPISLRVGNALAVLGVSTGGQPNALLKFGSPDEAESVLISGDLLTAVRKAFNASAQTNGPSSVTAVRVGGATQSSLAMTAAGANQLLLTSTIYGREANLIKTKIEAGTSVGLKATTAYRDQYFVGDNLYAVAMTVSYAGAAGTATIGIPSSATPTVILAAGGSTVASLLVSDSPTLGNLADRISAVAGFTATVTPGAELLSPIGYLDFVAATDCKTAPFAMTATLAAVINWFNGNAESLVTATRAAYPGGNVPPAAVGWTYLAGGTTTSPLLSDWTAALATLQSADVQWVVPLVGDAAVHAATDAHCFYMSNVAGKERRALVGPGVGYSAAQVKVLPKALDSDRTSLVWPGHYDYDDNGALVLLPPYMTAVHVAGGFAGSDPGTAMTNKTIKVRGLELAVRNPTDTDDLIQAGVLCIESTPEGYKVVRSVTTWLANDNFNRVEVSVGAATDFTVRNVREALRVLLGQGGSPRLIARAISITITALTELSRPKPAGPEVLVGDAANPAFRNVRATLVGDVLSVQYECSPVIPVNFIPQTASIRPYSGSASAAAAA